MRNFICITAGRKENVLEYIYKKNIRMGNLQMTLVHCVSTNKRNNFYWFLECFLLSCSWLFKDKILAQRLQSASLKILLCYIWIHKQLYCVFKLILAFYHFKIIVESVQMNILYLNWFFPNLWLFQRAKVTILAISQTQYVIRIKFNNLAFYVLAIFSAACVYSEIEINL